MKVGNCTLCGGRVVNGKCTECGMIYPDTSRNYKLNESDRDSESAETGDRSKPESPKKQHQQKQYRQKVNSQNTTPGYVEKKSGKGCIISLIIIAVAVVFIFFAGSRFIMNVVSSVRTYMENTDDSYSSSEAEAEYDYDPYATLKKELPDTGEHYEESYTAGYYQVGIDLPEGKYKVVLKEGYGYLSVSNSKNGIYLWETLDGNGNTEYEDVRLFSGAIVTIQSSAVVTFTTENGQIDTMETPTSNELTEEVKIKEKTVTAGKDFPAGTYDIHGLEGLGIIEYVLPEGTKVIVSDFSVKLVPSERMVTEEYEDFYNEIP